MSGVPTRILVGPTTYVHFHRKHKDYYVPDFLARPDFPSPEDSQHVWRYTVSPDHHNTVFFYNAATKKSVWVLPIVHSDGRTEELGDGEVMRAVRDKPSPLHSEAPSKTTDAEATAASASDEKLERQQQSQQQREKRGDVSRDAGEGQETEVQDRHDGPTEKPLAQNAPETVAAEPDPNESTKASPASPSTSSAPANANAGVSRDRMQAAMQRALQAANPLTISIGAGTSTADGSNSNHNEELHDSSQATTLQQRLAAWRAKRRQSPSEALQEEAVASTAAVGPVESSSKPESAAPPPVRDAASSPPVMVTADPLLAASSATPSAPVSDVAATTAITPAVKKDDTPTAAPVKPQPPTSTRAPQQTSSPAPSTGSKREGQPHREESERDARIAPAEPPSSLSSADHDHASPLVKRQMDPAAKARLAQEAELAKVAALLHQEKIRAMEQERAALECHRRALAVAAKEAAERARLTEAQTAAAQQRAEAAARAQVAQREHQRYHDDVAAAAARVRDVNAYVVKQTAMQAEAEATVADSFSYASRIAAQLAAAAPQPKEIKSALSAKGKGPTVPVGNPAFRAHRVGSGVAEASTRTSPFHTLSCNVLNQREGSKEDAGLPTSGTTAPQPTPARTRERICYGVPFVYDGEVVDYRPARTFVTNAQATRVKAKLHVGAIQSGSGEGNEAASPTEPLPDPPVLLTAKRDGVGTEYYDASQRHFFTGAWREDRRDGAGVLSLPNTAVQGHWQGDALTGPAVVQTKRAKANATFTTVSTAAPASSLPSAAAVKASRRSPLHSAEPTKGEAATTATTTPHAALNGNAVAELNNRALFVGALKDGRVAAPYVLQLGEGDYIEWLGASPKSTAEKKPSLSTSKLPHDRDAAAQPRQAKTTWTLTPSPRKGSGAAGTGECRIRFHNGDTFVGHVRDFQLHGTGYYRFAEDGQSYTGSFLHGLPHGDGLMVFANGDLYKGQFAKGLFDGLGSYACKAGDYVYEGNWVAGAMSGEGTLCYANGDVWKGVFRENTRVSGAYTTVA